MWWFVGGLTGFLSGFSLLTRGLERLGGEAVRRALGRAGREPVAAWLAGALAAALVHSSGLVSVATVSLVETGAMGFAAAIGAILGANVGTTATAQLMGFSSSALGAGAVVVGGVLTGLAVVRRWWGRRARRAEAWGRVVGGTGLVFLGLEAFKHAFQGLPSWVPDQLALLAGRPLGGVLAGTVLTGVMQSSTLFIGLVMNLAGQGLLDLPGAIHLMLGGNIGSCLPGLLAGAATGRAGRLTGLVNLVFNALGVLAVLPLLPAAVPLIAASAPSFARQVANAHTLFNVVTAVAALPLASPIGRWLEGRLLPPKPQPGKSFPR